MSEEEVTAVLGDDYEKRTEPDQYAETLDFEKTVTAFGEEAKAQIRFLVNEREEGKFFENLGDEALDYIFFEFSKESWEKVREKLEEEYGPSAGEVFGMEGTAIYKSKDKISDVEKSIQDKAYETYQDHSISQEDSDKENWLDSGINSVSLYSLGENYVAALSAGNLLYLLDAKAAE